MLEAVFRKKAAVGLVGLVSSLVSVEKIWNVARHLRMESDALLDDREAFGGRFHPGHVGGVVLGRLSDQREPDAAVVDANLVADLAPEQLVDGQAGGPAGYVPQGPLDCADCAAPGVECPQPAA